MQAAREMDNGRSLGRCIRFCSSADRLIAMVRLPQAQAIRISTGRCGDKTALMRARNASALPTSLENSLASLSAIQADAFPSLVAPILQMGHSPRLSGNRIRALCCGVFTAIPPLHQ